MILKVLMIIKFCIGPGNQFYPNLQLKESFRNQFKLDGVFLEGAGGGWGAGLDFDWGFSVDPLCIKSRQNVKMFHLVRK